MLPLIAGSISLETLRMSFPSIGPANEMLAAVLAAPSGGADSSSSNASSTNASDSKTSSATLHSMSFSLLFMIDPRQVPDDVADGLLAWSTSLDYNFNTLGYVLTKDSPATDEDYTENPNFPGWVFEVTYEFQVDGSLFAENGFGGLTIPILHDSPNKIGKNKVYPQVDGVIPEPTTIALLSIGTSLVGWLRRRKTL